MRTPVSRFRRPALLLMTLIATGAVLGPRARAGSSEQGALPTKAAPVSGYEAEDHFPGAALMTAVVEDTPAQAGATGIAPLPHLPIPVGASIDATVRPATPFRLAGTALDQARALECLTSAIYYEAASEPDSGQAAVAQVVLNRVRHPAFPATVCGAVFQGSEKAGCQFSFACDGAIARVPARAAWARARRSAARALAGYVFTPVGLATHYHTYAVRPSWQKSLVLTGVFGAHLFHRWQGFWGTNAAFRQRYGGGEPVPGPHPSLAPIAPVVLAAAAVSPSAPVLPTHVESGRPVASAVESESGAVLERWKDSGKPLR
jgi:spore germination cell wall hydrolase CwlJ-like protein